MNALIWAVSLCTSKASPVFQSLVEMLMTRPEINVNLHDHKGNTSLIVACDRGTYNFCLIRHDLCLPGTFLFSDLVLAFSGLGLNCISSINFILHSDTHSGFVSCF